MIMTRSLSVLLLTVALALAACGGGDITQPEPDPVGGGSPTTQPGGPVDTDIWGFDAPTNPDAVLLEWLSVGGFIPVEYNVGRAPRFVLTAGGQLYFQGPMTMIYPGPKLIRFQKVQLDQDQMSSVLQAISQTELVRSPEGSNETANQFVADADTSVFVLHHRDGTTSQYSIYAFGLGENQDADVAEFAALAAAVEAGSSGTPVDAAVERLQVVISPSGPVDDIELSSVAVWPFSDLGEVPAVFNDVRCLEVGGDDLAEAVALFDAGNDATFYESGDQTWRVLVRPLLVDEEACVTR